MKNLTAIIFLLSTFLRLNAQECPPEWVKFTFGEYIYNIESDANNRNIPEIEFKNTLLNIARSNLAKQIKINVQEVSKLDKTAINGRTAIRFSSSAEFATDVELKLVETRALYDAATRRAFAIAYIDRKRAQDFYSNELLLITNKIINHLESANNLIAGGEKRKAKSELEQALKLSESAENSICWMNLFGASQSEINEQIQSIALAEQNVRKLITSLEHHNTRIYLTCNAIILGEPYPTLQNELKGAISNKDCSFVKTPYNADWMIKISASISDKRTMSAGNSIHYFCYANAHIEITNMSTDQIILEDEISEKGGHTIGYTQAAKAAYKVIKQKLATIINQTIMQ